MKWLDMKVSLYKNHHDNIGRNEFTLKDILLTKFWYNIETIMALRKLDRQSSSFETEKKKLKDVLQAFTPAAELASRERDKVIEIKRTGLLQLDFDKKDNPKWDLEKLKNEIFKAYPFVAFCGKSCSGDGFYVLVAVAEPYKLKEYAEQLFEVFKRHDITIDRTKGRNVQDLRYVSYDENMLIREDPEPLKINIFFKDKEAARETAKIAKAQNVRHSDSIAEHWLKILRSCVPGNRMQTLQAVASALGSKRKEDYRNLIIQEINGNTVFEDQRDEFIKSANKIFEWGWKNQLTADKQA